MMRKGKTKIVIFIFVIIAYLAIMVFIYYKQFGISYNSDLGSYLSGVFGPISALGMIYISFLIYKLTSTEKRADDDFRLIIEIFYKIQETYELLKHVNQSTIDNINHNSYYERQIKLDCILLLNYLRRYPNKKYSISNIEKTIMGIYVNPNYESDYIELTDEIINFCYELNPEWDPTVFKIKK